MPKISIVDDKILNHNILAKKFYNFVSDRFSTNIKIWLPNNNYYFGVWYVMCY